MTGLRRRDEREVAQGLLPWLRAKIPNADEILLPMPCRPEVGGSSDTLFLEPTIREQGRIRRVAWVLRIEAEDQIYQYPSVERQYRVMQSLPVHSPVAVPQVLWYEADPAVIGAAFFLMERVDGAIPAPLHNSGGFLTQVTTADRELIWLSAIKVMAEIHSAPVGPFRFLDRPNLGKTGVDQEMASWNSYMRWSGAPLRPVQERACRWLHDHLPTNRTTGLAWGDAKPGNMIFRDNRCVAVIDWETASLGGAETDLGWWLFYDWLVSDGFGVPRLPGLGSRDDTIRVWQEFAGRKAQDMEWHEVFATWRFSLVSDRARHLARMRGSVDAPPMDARSPHADRLEMLLGS
jgi:aminoglycoside phosphotransferase (APT) family kinase protein